MLVLAIFILALYAVPYYYKSAQVEDWNSASFWVEQHYQPGDGLVCYDNATQQGCQVSLEYYLHAYPSAAHFSADAPGAFSWASFGSADPEAAVNPAVLTVFATKHPHIFFIVGRLSDNTAALQARYAQLWLDKHYHFITQIVNRTLAVRLYITSKFLDSEFSLFLTKNSTFLLLSSSKFDDLENKTIPDTFAALSTS